jgi:hypothetical protein
MAVGLDIKLLTFIRCEAGDSDITPPELVDVLQRDDAGLGSAVLGREVLGRALIGPPNDMEEMEGFGCLEYTVVALR